jgi:predicted dithiol-disulfide oxidoreductase (DUF899 family)
MPDNHTLTPANELAKKNATRFPIESEEYKRGREDLLRRHIERVAAQRRALPRAER